MSQSFSSSDIHVPHDVGQVLQAVMLPSAMGLSTSINAGGNVISNLLFMNGYKLFSFGLTSSEAGSISIQRYLDTAGTIKQGSALTASLSASTAAVYNLADTLPFQTMTIEVLNSSGSAATLSNVIFLMQAN
jgi:hypothetical protein